MDKKCFICGKKAKFKISTTTDHYCEDCALDYFGDLSCLVKVETDARKLRKVINSRMPKEDDDEKE